MALRGQTLEVIRTAVQDLKSFRVGNVSGSTELSGTGVLPETWVKAIKAANRRKQIKFVLYSYETPMAWLIGDEESLRWVQPDVHYSVSTTNHQLAFAAAIRNRSVAA